MTPMSNINTKGPLSPHTTNIDDPFVATPPHAHPATSKGSFFDDDESDHAADNATQKARNALEKYIKDTDKRIQEASTLGTSLLQSRKKLVAQLQSVSQQNNSENIAPQLQTKLVEIEREHAALSKETARAFTKTPRLDPDNNDSTMSPAVFSADTRSSPSKVAPPSRRQRNQPSSRVHDIEFATEISTSLLAQVRQLQAALGDKDDALKHESHKRSQLEMDVGALRQRMRIHDDSEQKYKDENWSLETQLQETTATIKDLVDKEQRLTRSLKTAEQAHDATQKQLEQIRLAHDKLEQDHAALKRQHDSELHGLRKDISTHQNERDQLQSRLDELSSRDEELARAMAKKSSNQLRSDGAAVVENHPASPDRDVSAYSPPPSPSKNARPGMLETETLKSSLQHAHRMIQTLKNNIHREKADKNELKRMLQDARDELELRRGDPVGNNVARKRRSEQEAAKQRKLVKADQLGAARLSREDIIMDDGEWEDHVEDDIIRSSLISTGTARPSSAVEPLAPTPGEETSDAFETANERDMTETEAFQTGNEQLSEDDAADLTETETPVKRKPRSSLNLGRARDRSSFQSTASASNDEGQDVTTPAVASAQPQKYKLKLGQRGKRYDRHGKLFEYGPVGAFDSPAISSTSSTRSTPAAPGQTLSDELAALSDDDNDTLDGTPSRSSVKSIISTPGERLVGHDAVAKRATASVMVDAGTMTEAAETEHSTGSSMLATAAGALGGLVAGLTGSALGGHTTHGEPTREPSLGQQEPADPALHSTTANEMPKSDFVPLIFQHTEPITPVASRGRARQGSIPAMALSEIVSQHLATRPTTPADQHAAPGALHRKSAAALSISGIEVVGSSEPDLMPAISDNAAQAQPLPALGLSNVNSQTTAPSEPISNMPTDDVTQARSSTKPNLRFGNVGSDVLFSGKEVDTRVTPATDSGTTIQSSGVDPVSTSMPTKPATASDGRPMSLESGDPSRLRQPLPQFYVPPASPPKVLANISSPRRSSESSAVADVGIATSAGATRNNTDPTPPLNLDRTQRIAAATQSPPRSAPGLMGPPLFPASAYANNQTTSPLRPRAGSASGPPRAGTNTSRSRGTVASSSGNGTINRKTSVSSFASEVDQRLNPGPTFLYPADVSPSTDPRMIQAITQTMIGEYLWKYTRKAGRSELSSTRHRRFFWVHPYTRTLYWSDQDPSTAGRHQLKAKSVAIEAIRTVEDTNTYPPGHFQKSIVIVTPGREIVFTAPTAQRHETWVNALSYLLLRTAPDVYEEAGGITDRDIAEFNPQPPGARTSSRATGRVSLSSYNSHTTTRTMSPQRRQPLVGTTPTLNNRQGQSLGENSTAPMASPSKRDRGSVSGRLSNFGDFFKPPESPRGRSSISEKLRSLSPSKREIAGSSSSLDRHGGNAIYDAQPVNDSNTDALKAAIEHGERDTGRLENVRACCNGRHDVGSLSRRHMASISHNASVTGSQSSRFAMSTHGHSHSHSHSTASDLYRQQEHEERMMASHARNASVR